MTTRLRLRGFQSTDADSLLLLNSQSEVQEFLGDMGVVNLEAMKKWIVTVNSNYPEGSERGYWAAESEGLFVGWFHLRPSRDTGETELGYRLIREAWGRGLATEGGRALIELAGGPVIARTLIPNQRSRRVMEKLGMVPVRTFSYLGAAVDDSIEYATA